MQARGRCQQEDFHRNFAHDLSADDALVMAVTQKAPLALTFGDAITDPAWRYKPSWYQVSTQDRMIDPDNKRRMARRINPRGVIELDSSHASLASHPYAIADLIEDAVAGTSKA